MNKFYIFFLGFLVLSACTTQKKRSDQSALKKAWHNTNAHYNGYFNANESVEESILILNDQHEDNYLKRLDIYEYSEVDNPQLVAEQLDEAVKKVTIVVNLHPYSQWSDDCYLIAGKALFLKQDYESAEKAFRYLIREYPPENKEEAKQQKKSSKKKKSGNSRSKKSSNSEKTTSSSTVKTKKQREKERRAYNKEVARKKKQRERDKRKGKTSPKSSPKPTETPKVETPDSKPSTVANENETDVEPPRVGLVHLTAAPDNLTNEDDDQYKMKHRPAFQEGQLWLARTLIERDNYNGARRILNNLAESSSTFKDVRRDAAVAQAHLAIKEADYALATTALNNAVDVTNDNDFKARLAFILGQLQQDLGNSSAAYAAFEKVVKSRPVYEMVFAAQLNMAQNAYLTGDGDGTKSLANLEKLLREEKNEPYKDQIYFAMAQIAFDQGDEEKGIVLIQQSLASNTSNRAQKAEAYYYLAELYYGKEAYLPAKLYYDSTLNLMAKADERYIQAERLRDNLVDIATNLEIITLQDSLLLIATYTDEQRADLAKKIQTQRNEEAAAANNTGRDKFGRGGFQSVTPGAGNPQDKNAFWAYDETARKRRERAYKKKWGDRVLEDNWRRSNSSDTSIEEAEAVEPVDVNLLTEDQINEILKDVPDSDGAKLAAELKVKKAMFELGRLYKDRMENNEKCIEILEKLNERFPAHLHELDSWYYLYLAHTELGHTSQAKEYRDKIIQKYPSSSFGQILVNPNYAQEQMDEEFQLNKTYDAVYALFEKGAFQEVIQQSEQNINRIIGDHVLKPRYALLKAMSTGSTAGKEAYILELQKVISTYSDTPEETRAKEILRLLGGAGAKLPGGAKEEETGDFTMNESELHYVLIVFETDEIDLNANKIKVSDYNKKYHSLDRIRISNVYLGEKNNVPVLVLRRFKDKQKAMDFYDGIQKNQADFIDAAVNSYEMFPISQSNYREVLRNRSVEGYGAFFRNNY